MSDTKYQPLLARAADDDPDPLYPLPGTGVNSFITYAEDGSRVQMWEAEALTATMANAEVGRATNVKAGVALTDTRLVVACTEFRTGGGWRGYGLGGAAVAITANAISRAAASRGTRGYSLVGQVRHEWLRAVVATRSSWGTSTANAISLVWRAPVGSNEVCRLNIHMPKRTVTADVARDLLRRALTVQIAGAEGDRRRALEQFLARLPSEPTENGRGESWLLPS